MYELLSYLVWFVIIQVRLPTVLVERLGFTIRTFRSNRLKKFPNIRYSFHVGTHQLIISQEYTRFNIKKNNNNNKNKVDVVRGNRLVYKTAISNMPTFGGKKPPSPAAIFNRGIFRGGITAIIRPIVIEHLLTIWASEIC